MNDHSYLLQVDAGCQFLQRRYIDHTRSGILQRSTRRPRCRASAIRHGSAAHPIADWQGSSRGSAGGPPRESWGGHLSNATSNANKPGSRSGATGSMCLGRRLRPRRARRGRGGKATRTAADPSSSSVVCPSPCAEARSANGAGQASQPEPRLRSTSKPARSDRRWGGPSNGSCSQPDDGAYNGVTSANSEVPR